jgi:hypothetical protein
MMTNCTEVHEQIASNIPAALKPAMNTRHGRCYQGGIRVQLADNPQARVEHYRPGERGFELEVLKRPEDIPHLDAVDLWIDLAGIYFDVRL